MRIKNKKIVFLNATFEGNAHEIIDTSIIYCASKIFQNVKVRFLKDRSDIVQEQIKEYFKCSNITFQPFFNIKKNINGYNGLGNNSFSRLISKFRIALREIISALEEVVEYISCSNRDSIFCLTYINRYNCFLLNFACKILQRPLYIFCHSEIEYILLDEELITSNYIKLQYRFLTATSIAKNIKLVVLGDSILNNISKTLNKDRLIHFTSVDHPYYNTFNKQQTNSIKDKKNINIGVIGNLTHSKHRGFYNVLSLANNLKNTDNITINILGKTDRISYQELDGLAKFYNKSGLLISREEYDNNIDKMDYIYIPYPIDSFNFTASGSLLEAICKLKPVLYHRNCYTNYIINKFGEFGIDIDKYETPSLIKILTNADFYEKLIQEQIDVANKISPQNLIAQYYKLFNQI